MLNKLICFSLFFSWLYTSSLFDEHQRVLKRRFSVAKEKEFKGFTATYGVLNLQRSHDSFIDIAYNFKFLQYDNIYCGAGFFVTALQSRYLYSFLSGVCPLGFSKFVVIPSFSIGYYTISKGFDLGSKLEFHSGLSVAYCGDWCTIGVKGSHMSNAHIGKKNPGLEAFGIFFNLRSF